MDNPNPIPQQPPLPKAGNRFPIKYIAALALVIILVAGAYFVLRPSSIPGPGGSTANNSSLQSTGNISTVQGQNISSYLINESEAASIVGGGGHYSAKNANSTQLSTAPAIYGVVAGASMAYNITIGNSTGAVIESVLLAKNTTGTYNFALNAFSYYFNLTGVSKPSLATTDGMGYIYASSNSLNTTLGNSMIIIGKKNSEVVVFLASSRSAIPSVQYVAANVSKRLP